MNIKTLSRICLVFGGVLFILSAKSFANDLNKKMNKFSSQYELTFNKASPNKVHAKASIHVSRGKIRMLSWGHPWLKNGWATFVEDLQIEDEEGNQINYSLIEEDGWGAWAVPVEDETKISLSYAVKLEYFKYDWNKAGGQDSRPEWVNGALFAVSRAFFIYSYLDTKSIVNFQYPKSWQLALPWKALGEEENSYFVPSNESLLSNAFVIGDFSKGVLNLDGFKINIAIDNSLKQYSEKIEHILASQSKAYKEIFGQTPEMEEYVVSIRAANEDDGEAYYNSFNQVIKPSSIGSSDTTITWANTMGHEMFHNWFGYFILNRTTYEDTANKHEIEWFNEGFTEYVTSKALFQKGLISTSGYLKKLEKYASRDFITAYMWPEKQVSLAESGKDKHKNWLRVYGGGSMLALALDIDLHVNSNGKQNLASLFRLLAEKYGPSHSSYITNKAILDTLNELSGRSYNDFFQKYVWGTEYLDITPFLEQVGIRAVTRTDEFFLHVPEKSEKKFREFVF